MGQKANPVSLRLKTTNKNFDSCWYSDLHYSNLLSLELRARSYIEKVFEQIRYPKPLISLSLIPKRGKVLIFYLNPERLRGQRNERFQLKSFIPPRNLESHAHHLPTRSTEASHMLGLDGSVGTLRPLLVKGSLLHVEPRNSSWKPEINQVQPNRPWERAPASYKQGGWMPNWERRLFIYSTLLSITKRRSNTVRLLFEKDFALFHRVQRLVWFQGRKESCLSSTNRHLPINDKQAGGTLTRAHRYKGRGIPFSTPQTSLATNWGAEAPNPLIRGGRQVGKPSSRGSSLSRGSYTTQTPLARGLYTWCARGLPLVSGLTGWGREMGFVGHPRPTRGKGPHTTDEPLVRRRALVAEIGVKSKRLDGYLWPKPSIREIRREDVHSSIYFMEIALGRGLGISTTIYPYKSMEEEQTAQFLSEEIAYYLERRIPFRRIKQALIRELQKKYIEGIKVSCSGRVGGRSKKAQRSREESFQWGQTSSHVFSSKLSFASRSALTPFGKVGIKVWICYK